MGCTGAQMLVLYGRRRIGKTSLFTHWIKIATSSTRCIGSLRPPALAQLRPFTGGVQLRQPEAGAGDFFLRYLGAGLAAVANLARTQRLALFIDEFTYLLEVTPGIAGNCRISGTARSDRPIFFWVCPVRTWG